MPLNNEELEQRINELTEKIAVLNERVDTHPPVGTVILLAGTTPPVGYMLCNGRAVRRDRFADLFALIGVSWGAGDGSTTFNIPDLRGQFLRVHNPRASSGADKARVIGALQGGGTRMPRQPFQLSISNQQGHSHSVTENGAHTHSISSDGKHQHTMSETGNHSHVTTAKGAHNHDTTLKTGSPLSFGGRGPETDAVSRRALTRLRMRVTGDAGEHTHPISSNGKHAHSIRMSGDHSHTANSTGSHRHNIGAAGAHSHDATISGGDPETRPTNHALAAFIRTGV